MRKYLILTVVVLLAFGTALAVGCGGDDSPVGEYKWKSGEDALQELTVTLKDDGTFTISGENPETGETASMEGKWSQDGSEVTLTLGEGDEAENEVGEYKDGELVFDDVVWVKKE